jgi:undecaprenyl diphosphate synthase
MLDKFKGILKKTEKGGVTRPNHVAFTTEGKTIWSRKHAIPISQVYKNSFETIRECIGLQLKLNIPITTYYLLSSNMSDLEQFSVLIDSFVEFFSEMKVSELIHSNRIKVSVFGKWYDLPGRVIDPIKNIIENTMNYDNYFVNFCINYNGQEEIVDACKLLARQIKADRLDPDAITPDLLRENLYASSFLPPDLIIKNGLKKGKSDLLLWDSVHAFIHYTYKFWPDFEKRDFQEAIEAFSRKFS